MRRTRLIFALLMLLTSLFLPIQAGAQDDDEMSVLAWGLERPRGLSFDADGNLVATLVGSGDGHLDGRVVHFRGLHPGDDTDGAGFIMKDLVTQLPTSDFFPGEFGGAKFGPSDAQVTADGQIYFVTNAFIHDPFRTGWSALWSTSVPNTTTNPLMRANPYAHFVPYEIANNPDGDVLESNPYALVVDGEGNAYVSDAASNAVFMVTPDGTISTYTVFDALPHPSGDGTIHVAPTGIVWGPDGALYVGSETGAPWPEGGSPVWRLEDTNGDGDAMDAGETSVYVDGLTTVTDIAFDNQGRLLALEFRYILTGEDMYSGRVMRWNDGEWEVLASGLPTPTGIAVGPDGTIYVSLEYVGQIVQLHR